MAEGEVITERPGNGLVDWLKRLFKKGNKPPKTLPTTSQPSNPTNDERTENTNDNSGFIWS